MKKTILTLTIATLLIAPTLRAEEVNHPPINPALLYWQAASELPQLSNEQAKELADMASGRQAFDPAKAKNLLESATTLRLMRKAVDSTAACDWGLPTEDGPGTILPHLAKMRQMSGLAIVQAEAFFAEGKVKQGLDSLLIAHRMARHAGAGDLLISYLVQNAMEANAIRAAARHCLGWDTETRRGYATALQSLPPLHTAQAAFHGEHIFIDWAESHLRSDGKSDAELQAALASAAAEQPGSKEAAASLLAPDTTKAALAAWRDMLARMTTALGKPWPQAQLELKALEDEAWHSSHVLVRVTVPSTMSVAEKGFTVATLRTMLDAALEHGPQLDEAAASTYHDSLEGEPLQLKKGDNGTLTLKAAHPHPAGKEISLQLGK
jgi:hypothetical protein